MKKTCRRRRRGNQRITRAEIRPPPNKAEGRFLVGIADLGRLTDGQMHIPTWGQYRECQRETAPEKAAGCCSAEHLNGGHMSSWRPWCNALSNVFATEDLWRSRGWRNIHVPQESEEFAGDSTNWRLASELHRSQCEKTKTKWKESKDVDDLRKSDKFVDDFTNTSERSELHRSHNYDKKLPMSKW